MESSVPPERLHQTKLANTESIRNVQAPNVANLLCAPLPVLRSFCRVAPPSSNSGNNDVCADNQQNRLNHGLSRRWRTDCKTTPSVAKTESYTECEFPNRLDQVSPSDHKGCASERPDPPALSHWARTGASRVCGHLYDTIGCQSTTRSQSLAPVPKTSML